MNKQAGFTLAEIMVVTSVIVILSGVIWVSLNNSTLQSRDAQRQADLRTMQAALELYKQEYGRYPEGCNPAGGMDFTTDAHWIGIWSGEKGTDYECSDGSAEYIRNDLSATAETENFAPQFIPILPTDEELNGTDSGYVYTTNPDGTVYKLIALNTVEAETVTYLHPLARCGDMNLGQGANGNECARIPTPTGFYPGGNPCGTYNCFGAAGPSCSTPGINNDYAVWGGYASRGYQGIIRETEKAREYFSDVIRCK